MKKLNINDVCEFYKNLGFEIYGEYAGVDKPVKCMHKNGYFYNYSITNLRTAINKGVVVPNHTFSYKNPYCIENINIYIKNNNVNNTVLLSKNPVRDKEKYKFKCGVCGNFFYQEFKTYRNSNPYKCCQKCARKIANKKESLSSDNVYEEYLSNGYKLLEDYKGVHYPHIVININTGRIGQLSLCSARKTSQVKHRFDYESITDTKHEKLFEMFLNKNNIKYIKQYLLNCSYKKRLRVDFYLYDLGIAVEIDGDTHLYDYRKQITKDKLKEKYLKDNNIKLIRLTNKDIDDGNIINKLQLEKS